MTPASSLSASISEQHSALCELAVRRAAEIVDASGLRAEGQPLHDFVRSRSSFVPSREMKTMIWIKSIVRLPTAAGVGTDDLFAVVRTFLDGNLWVTEAKYRQEKPQPPHLSGGSALYGSPQDATENKIRQPPSIRDSQGYIWNVYGRPLSRGEKCHCCCAHPAEYEAHRGATWRAVCAYCLKNAVHPSSWGDFHPIDPG